MKKKISKKRPAVRTAPPAVDQLELALVAKSATIFAFPPVQARNQPKQNDDATRRLLEFAARLPDW